MIEEGLDPKVVVHTKSLELLGQREVCENHVIDLNHVELIFNQTEERFDTWLPVDQKGSPLQTS